MPGTNKNTETGRKQVRDLGPRLPGQALSTTLTQHSDWCVGTHVFILIPPFPYSLQGGSEEVAAWSLVASAFLTTGTDAWPAVPSEHILSRTRTLPERQHMAFLPGLLYNILWVLGARSSLIFPT